MTQSSSLGNIINMARTLFRGKVNDCFKAVTTQNAGDSPPDPPYENMFWFDTANGLVKLRDPSNSYWQTIGVIGPPFLLSAVDSNSGVLTSSPLSGASSVISGIPTNAHSMDITIFGAKVNVTSGISLQLGTISGLVTTGYAGIAEEVGAITTTANTEMPVSCANMPTTGVIIGNVRCIKTTSNRWSIMGISGNIATPVGINSYFSGSVVLPGDLTQVALKTTAGVFTTGYFEIRWFK